MTFECPFLLVYVVRLLSFEHFPAVSKLLSHFYLFFKLSISEFLFLFQGKYFLVKDIPQKTDRKYEFYRAPNFRKACPNLPVWACGQPTERGLSTILDSLSNEGFTVSSVVYCANKIL